MVYYNLGKVYYITKNYDRSLQNFTQVVNLNPQSADGYYNRGIVYEIKGLDRQALDDFDRALQIDPNMAKAQVHRSRVAIKLKIPNRGFQPN